MSGGHAVFVSPLGEVWDPVTEEARREVAVALSEAKAKAIEEYSRRIFGQMDDEVQPMTDEQKAMSAKIRASIPLSEADGLFAAAPNKIITPSMSAYKSRRREHNRAASKSRARNRR